MLAAPLEDHETNWKCALLCIRSPRRLSEVLSSTKFFLNSCSQLGNSCDISLCTSFDSLFLFRFLVSVESCNGSLRSSSFIPLFLSDTGTSTSLVSDTESLVSDVDSCDEDGDEADEGAVVEELADIPGTINGTLFDILQSIRLPSLMRCGF